ncbi:hypothetical protein PVK06_015120 [Gossypium arboreum]|uniref:50S ribosomal protein L34, chloroplastic n=1 Tax=Gossypium arboreum TaxID=29729 RepID=A0ABR0PWB4_GOSAR|nr:hypothetical protein PVK06_015120 [Gossypium arboreum]
MQQSTPKLALPCFTAPFSLLPLLLSLYILHFQVKEFPVLYVHCVSSMGVNVFRLISILHVGLSLGMDFSSNNGVRNEKRRCLVVRAGKAALCQTKRNRSRKSLARTHGFRRRMRTTSGIAVLKRRRAKGRKVLCTKSNPNSGKR